MLHYVEGAASGLQSRQTDLDALSLVDRLGPNITSRKTGEDTREQGCMRKLIIRSSDLRYLPCGTRYLVTRK